MDILNSAMLPNVRRRVENLDAKHRARLKAAIKRVVEAPKSCQYKFIGMQLIAALLENAALHEAEVGKTRLLFAQTLNDDYFLIDFQFR